MNTVNWMKRFIGQEITLQRIFAALVRRFREIPHSIAWSFPNKNALLNIKRLRSWHNVHLGERCFVMGNGPSLAKMDLSLLKDEITFGLNRIYLLFDQLEFVPTYYVSINELVLEQFAEEIKTVDAPKFLNWNRRQYFTLSDSSVHFLKTRFPLHATFNRDISKPLYGGSTVTYVTLQIAHYMGFQKAILIGVDHSFVEKGTPNIVELRESEIDESHFAPNYFPKGVKWQLPDLVTAEFAYKLAKETYEKDGREILDATLDGKLEVFPKADYQSTVKLN